MQTGLDRNSRMVDQAEAVLVLELRRMETDTVADTETAMVTDMETDVTTGMETGMRIAMVQITVPLIRWITEDEVHQMTAVMVDSFMTNKVQEILVNLLFFLH